MNEPLLKPATYEVLRRIPNEFMHEESVKELISQATDQPAASVRRRMNYLVRVNVVQRKQGVDGPEVRRCAW